MIIYPDDNEKGFNGPEATAPEGRHRRFFSIEALFFTAFLIVSQVFIPYAKAGDAPMAAARQEAAEAKQAGLESSKESQQAAPVATDAADKATVLPMDSLSVEPSSEPAPEKQEATALLADGAESAALFS
ncbi:MAG: hypothetical protein NUW09_04530, partial [Deltaproteobacteria bacterium]|nr:hypothetical protein [Deltaproteobacteria bacterium]